MSLSIKASKISPLVQIYLRNGVVVSGATPDHFSDINNAEEDINDILGWFQGKGDKKKVYH